VAGVSVFRVELARSRWRRQRWFVRLIWVANGLTAMHSETYRDRRDAMNLVDKLEDALGGYL